MIRDFIKTLFFPYRFLRDKYRYYRRMHYMPLLKKGLGENFSIISSNCFAGRITQDLKIPYSSPTAGLFFFFEDYVEFVEHFDDYITRNVVIIPKSKWSLANEKMETREFVYPIGKIEGTNVEIHFLHYHTAEEALEKWERRSKRINLNRLFVAFWQNLPNLDAAKRFLSIRGANTILLSTVPIPEYSNCIYISELKKFEEAPNPYLYARFYYKYLANYLAKKEKTNVC